MDTLPWLCRLGWHRWRRAWMTARPSGFASVTTYRCGRDGCPAIRHEQHVPAPTEAPV